MSNAFLDMLLEDESTIDHAPQDAFSVSPSPDSLSLEDYCGETARCFNSDPGPDDTYDEDPLP